MFRLLLAASRRIAVPATFDGAGSSYTIQTGINVAELASGGEFAVIGGSGVLYYAGTTTCYVDVNGSRHTLPLENSIPVSSGDTVEFLFSCPTALDTQAAYSFSLLSGGISYDDISFLVKNTSRYMFAFNGTLETDQEFVVPFGVTALSLLCVGQGGPANHYVPSTLVGGGGGGAGAVAYTNDVLVTPGETLALRFLSTSGLGYCNTYYSWLGSMLAADGAKAAVSRGTTALVAAVGGEGAAYESSTGAAAQSTTKSTGTVRRAGGAGSNGAASKAPGGGGNAPGSSLTANGTIGTTGTAGQSYGRSGDGIVLSLSGGISVASGTTSSPTGKTYGGGAGSRSDGATTGYYARGGDGLIAIAYGRQFSTAGTW